MARRSWPCLSRQRREPEINKREHGTWTAFSASPRARVAMASIQKYSAGGTLISTWRLRRREKTNRQEVNTFPPHDVCTHVSVCDARPGRDFQKIYSTAQRLRMNSCAREWSSRVIFRQTKFPTWLISFECISLRIYLCAIFVLSNDRYNLIFCKIISIFVVLYSNLFMTNIFLRNFVNYVYRYLLYQIIL